MGDSKSSGSPKKEHSINGHPSEQIPLADGVPIVGGEKEKMPPEEGKLMLADDQIAVKFISADSQNGDAKIDIENVKAVFSGMGKEELMKYANDPFWIRLRWFLFIMFWVLWLTMLAGAIVIIVFAPKCPPPAPREWWQKSPIYQVYTRSFKDGAEPADGIGDIEGIRSRLNHFVELGTNAISVTPLLRTKLSENDDGIEDFRDINPVFGTLEEFKNLLKEMAEKGLYFILGFVPNHTSDTHEWFLKSVEGEEQYKDYYVWAPSKGQTRDGKHVEPNNWKSVYGGSAWTWNEKRGEFYLHQFRSDQPDLNFHNDAVVEEMKDILKYWLELGVSGFHIDGAEYLLEDAELGNETMAANSRLGATHEEYNFYTHFQTKNQPDLPALLKKFRDVLDGYEDEQRILVVEMDSPAEYIQRMYGSENASVAHIPVNHNLITSLKPDFNAEDLKKAISDWTDTAPSGTWPNWQLGNAKTSRVSSRLGAAVIDGLNVVVSLLRGTPLIYYGEELGMENGQVQDSAIPELARKTSAVTPMQWANSSHAGFTDGADVWLPVNTNFETVNVETQLKQEESHLKVLVAMLGAARKSNAFLHGEINMIVLDADVFAYTRLKKGNPGYLVAFNTGIRDLVVNLKANFTNLSPKAEIYTRSTGFRDRSTKIRGTVDTDAVKLGPKDAVVLSFVPNYK